MKKRKRKTITISMVDNGKIIGMAEYTLRKGMPHKKIKDYSDKIKTNN